jgi:hypothetical protein
MDDLIGKRVRVKVGQVDAGRVGTVASVEKPPYLWGEPILVVQFSGEPVRWAFLRSWVEEIPTDASPADAPVYGSGTHVVANVDPQDLKEGEMPGDMGDSVRDRAGLCLHQKTYGTCEVAHCLHVAPGVKRGLKGNCAHGHVYGDCAVPHCLHFNPEFHLPAHPQFDRASFQEGYREGAKFGRSTMEGRLVNTLKAAVVDRIPPLADGEVLIIQCSGDLDSHTLATLRDTLYGAGLPSGRVVMTNLENGVKFTRVPEAQLRRLHAELGTVIEKLPAAPKTPGHTPECECEGCGGAA